MAQYAIFLYAPKDEIDEDPEPELLAPYERYGDELNRSGTQIAAFPLQPVSTATSIRPDVVTDGPFLETKEVVIGVYVIEARDLDAALEIAKRNPILTQGGGLEVRPVAT
jgi:hypothetical protein